MKEIISQVTVATAKTGQPYATLTLQPSNRQVHVWNIPKDHNIKRGLIFDSDQDTIYKKSLFSPTDPTFLKYLPSAITKEQWNQLGESLSKIIPPTRDVVPYNEVYLDIHKRLYLPYSTHTAAKHNHHNFDGGLLQHTYEILNIYLHIYDALPFKTNPFIVCIAALFHDYGKLDEYLPETYDYTDYMFLKGHVFGSAEALGAFLANQDIPRKLILHCQHAVLAHHGKPEWGSLYPATPEAFLLHHLDMLSGFGVQYNQPNGTKINGTQICHYQ